MIFSVYKRILFIFIIVVSIVSACNPPSKLSNRNLSYSYKRNLNILHPQFLIQHSDSNNSLLHFSLFTSELLYVKQGESKFFTANVLVSYRLLPSYDSKQVIDTGSVVIIDKFDAESNALLNSKISFKAKYPNNYVIEVVVTDINRNISSKTILNVYKNDSQSAQYFLLCDTVYKQPLFRNVLKKDEYAYLTFKGMIPDKHINKIYVRYYNRQLPFPPPPYSQYTPKPFDYKADSLFVVPLDSNFSAKINLKGLGFYHFQIDTTVKSGFTVYRFEEDFPYINSASQLIPPVRYISTQQEFDELKSASNPKLAVDLFWEKNGTNRERSRALLKAYYNRVQESNQYFTSYCEGWKTDRGIIYTIFGQPNTLYKQENTEIWVYGEEASYKSLSFVFVKVINPFSENDYQLNRMDLYRDEWNRAVDSWRTGRAYNER